MVQLEKCQPSDAPYIHTGEDASTSRISSIHVEGTLDKVKRYLAIVQADIEKAHRRASPVDNWAL